MEELVKGDIVVVPFPFSDLSKSKRRPALILANLEGDDLILAQITKSRTDKYSIDLPQKEFQKGRLISNSFVRPNRLFTADKSIIIYRAGKITNTKMKEIQEKIIKIITD